MKIAVFCASSHPRTQAFAQAAASLGEGIAIAGHTLLYGGSNLGLMGVVSSAAMEHGGHVVAVIPTLFSEEIINSQRVTELVRVRSMAERKERLLADADAFVVLPGGIGTLDEISEVMVANQLRQIDKPMVLLNIDGFFDAFLAQLAAMRAEGFLRTDGGLVTAASVDDVFLKFQQIP
ncbi:MAG: TIGR00730 family Rossman fold protein [Bacteroidales bacterium]|nr:TIGR00730 family Rossman fold protein [Bacteroidales bacterium]